MTSRRLLMKTLLVCAPLVAACENTVEVKGTIVSPAAVEALFSPQQPGELRVQVIGPTRSYEARDGAIVFCGATPSSDREITFSSFDFGCMQDPPIRVLAWVTPRTSAEIDCAHPPASLPGSFYELEKARASAVVAATTTIDSSLGACESGTIHFDLTLAPGATLP